MVCEVEVDSEMKSSPLPQLTRLNGVDAGDIFPVLFEKKNQSKLLKII